MWDSLFMDEGRDRADALPSADALPWPLSALDASAVATRRRGDRFFRVALLLLAGGSSTEQPPVRNS
ncbi:MAG TPA: hypothetical protein VG275_11430 [Solirubrobacteraceae bacterium]|jgi:hypothetical protein|nr:hypothetical protein [Solirubrobacteraceae bacterium]